MLIFLQAPFLKRLLDFLLVLLSTQTPPISSVLVSPPHYSKQSRIPPLVQSTSKTSASESRQKVFCKHKCQNFKTAPRTFQLLKTSTLLCLDTVKV